MDFDISVAEDRQYILVDVRCPMTSEVGAQCASKATALGRTENIKRYLFDLRGAPNVQGLVQDYEFAYDEMASFGFPRDARTALLTDPSDKSHDVITTFFSNAGYSFKLFADWQSAEAWLEG